MAFYLYNGKQGRRKERKRMDSIQKIIKRDGRMVDFDVDKIADAIFKAAQVLGGRDREMSVYLASVKGDAAHGE